MTYPAPAAGMQQGMEDVVQASHYYRDPKDGQKSIHAGSHSTFLARSWLGSQTSDHKVTVY